MANNNKMIYISVDETRLPFKLKALTEASEYFQVMFNGKFEESELNEIKLADVQIKSFKIFHLWVHGFRKEFIDLNLQDLIQLVIFADRFMVDRMKEQIYKRISQLLNLIYREVAVTYQVLQTSTSIGDLVLKDIFFKWLEESLVAPTEWNRDIIIDFTERIFRHKESVRNSDLSNEETKGVYICLEKSHKKLMILYADYFNNQYLRKLSNERTQTMSLYLESLFKLNDQHDIEVKVDKISVEEHQILHEWLFDFRKDFHDQPLTMQLRLMAIAHLYKIELPAWPYYKISTSIDKETEPSALLYSVVETNLLNGDSNLKTLFSLWLSRKFQDCSRMNLNQLLQSTARIFSWQYDIKVKKFALSEEAVKEIEKHFEKNATWLTFYYEAIMDKSDRDDLVEGINQMKQLEEKLKDCGENQQEFMKFVTQKRHEYEKNIETVVKPAAVCSKPNEGKRTETVARLEEMMKELTEMQQEYEKMLQ